MVYAIFYIYRFRNAGGYFFWDWNIKTCWTRFDVGFIFYGFCCRYRNRRKQAYYKKICNPQSILLAVAIPTAVTIGSLGGAALSAFVTGWKCGTRCLSAVL
ncbi:MAG: hypothetical protein ACLRXQ_05880 [Phascolarctobacterium faecium]